MVVRETRLRKGPRGWFDENTIVEFAKYVAYVAWKLRGLVNFWVPFNEPAVVPETGYVIRESGFPPGLFNFRASRKVAKHLVVAHARSYDAIKKINAGASVGLIHNVIPARPFSPKSESDIEAAKFMDNMHNHFFVQSISEGWLDENLNGIKENGELKEYLAQRLDWIGVNYYSRFLVKGGIAILAKVFAGIPALPQIVPNYGFACQPNSKSADGLQTSDVGWEIYPEGLLEALNAMQRYKKPIYVTENGLADQTDALRPRFMTEHLKVLERAINEEGIDVRGYFHWALTDNYEWAKGYGPKFGLCSVDIETKARKCRKSAEVYRDIAKGLL
jgi:beta-galactosidase